MLDYHLQEQLRPHMQHMVPLPSIYYPDFIAANQTDRADNVVPGQDKMAHLEHIRKDIREFKKANGCDTVSCPPLPPPIIPLPPSIARHLDLPQPK